MSLNESQWQTARRLGLERQCRAGDARYLALVRDVESGRRPEPSLPPLPDQMYSAMVAVGHLVAALFSGEPVQASPALRAARLAVCQMGQGLAPGQTVEYHCDQYRPSDGRCAACGCWVQGVAGAASVATKDCPLGRWPRE